MKLFQSRPAPTVLYVTRAGIGVFFADTDQASMIPFSPDLFPDLEVTAGEEELRQQLLTWQQKASVTLSQCIVVLASDVYFFQDTTSANANDDPAIQQYLSAIPFEDVKTHLVGVSSGSRVVALNNEWYMTLMKVMEKLRWNITMVLPDFVVVDMIKPEGFDFESAQAVRERADTLSPYNMYSPPPVPEAEQKLHFSTSTKITPTTIGLIVFFFILLIVLGVVAYLNIFSVAKVPPAPVVYQEPEQVVSEIPATTTVPTFSLTPASGATISGELGVPKDFSIQILNGSGVENQATQLRAELLDKGFEQVLIGNASNSAISKTVVVFAESVPGNVQTLVTDTLKSLGFSPSIQVTTEQLDTAIVITTGKEQQIP